MKKLIIYSTIVVLLLLGCAPTIDSPEKQRSEGDKYYTGIGASKDIEKAKYWYKKAAEQGDIKAQIALGHIYRWDPPVDYEMCKYWYQKAAEQGHAKSQYFLGSMYHREAPVDYELAEYWYKKAAEQGEVVSMVKLSLVNFRTKQPLHSYAWISIAMHHESKMDKDLLKLAKEIHSHAASTLSTENLEKAEELAEEIRKTIKTDN